MNLIKQSCSLFIFLSLALFIYPNSSSATGFSLMGHSAEGTGYAYAGATAGYSDASSVFFNPASMTSLERPTITLGGHIIPYSYEFKDQGSNVSGMPNSSPGGNGRDKVGLIPNLEAVIPISDRVATGFVLTSPFGLTTEYPREWVGRYQAITSDLLVLQMGPAVAVEVFDGFSIGGGMNAFYADAELSNAVDFGSIGYATLGTDTAGMLGLFPQSADGFAKLTGDDWGMGWNIGASYKYGEGKRSRIGFNYRSKVDLSLRGDAEFEVPQSALPLTALGTFTNSRATADLTLPDTISFGVIQELSPCWSLLYDSAWTQWSRFEKVEVNFDNPAQPNSLDMNNWGNSWRHAVGVRFSPVDEWAFRAGFMYDRSPVRSSSNLSPRIPDNDQYWVAVGASRYFNTNIRADLSYAHVFYPDGNSNRTGQTGDVLVGEWESSYDAISLALVMSF